jgi:hypothetical protein
MMTGHRVLSGACVCALAALAAPGPVRAGRPRVEVKEDGRTLRYEGVLVGEILKRAGAPLGAELRGNAVASYVVAFATDGYQVVFSLAERLRK